MKNNMTALISCFARAYHFKNNTNWIFRDNMADKLLTPKEYEEISLNMAKGISYFNPDFTGTTNEALRFIADNQLSPSVLARSSFCEHALKNSIMLGVKQYVIFASGYDTFSLRYSSDNLKIYELDRVQILSDKLNRIKANNLKEKCNTKYIPCDLSKKEWIKSLTDSGFEFCAQSFGSLLGISYYLKKENFKALLNSISSVWCAGSSICFDYPSYEEGKESQKNQELAKAADEPMLAKYSYGEIEKLLENSGFLIYEHLDHTAAAKQFFDSYNAANPPYKMYAPKGVCYCLAVKKPI